MEPKGHAGLVRVSVRDNSISFAAHKSNYLKGKASSHLSLGPTLFHQHHPPLPPSLAPFLYHNNLTRLPPSNISISRRSSIPELCITVRSSQVSPTLSRACKSPPPLSRQKKRKVSRSLGYVLFSFPATGLRLALQLISNNSPSAIYRDLACLVLT